MQFKYSVLAASLAAALTLSGCGGGGDSSPAPAGAVGGNTGGSEELPIGGGVVITAMDGYLKHALVCVDYDEKKAARHEEPSDGKCTADDIFNGRTLDGGEVTIPEKHLNKGPLLVQTIIPGKEYPGLEKLVGGYFTIDEDFPFEPMNKDVTFRAPQGANVISPITDLVVAKIEAGQTQEQAEKAVAQQLQDSLGIDSIDLYDNYVEAGAKGDIEAKKLHKTAQILTNTQAAATKDGIESIDAVLDDVVETAATEVKEMDETALKSDSDQSISVPITDTDGSVTAEKEVETTVKPVVIEQARKDLQTALTNHTFDNKYFAAFEAQLVPLFDQEGTKLDATIISNAADLQNKGITASIKGNTLRIEAAQDMAVKAGDYTLTLTNAGKTATAFVEFKVETYQSAPTIDESTQGARQQDISKLKLQAKVEMVAESFNISGLFDDKDGDPLTVTVQPGTSGLKFDLSGDNLEISGTPNVAGDFTFTITATDTDNNQVVATFNLPTIAAGPITNTPLSDLLVGQTLYRFNANWVQVDDVEHNNNHRHPKPDCWAIRLTDDHKVMEAEMVKGQCPAEDSEFIQSGTWAFDGDNIAVSFYDDGTETLSLNKDLSTAELARVHLFSTSAKVSGDTTAPATFYIGEQAATAYWNQPESHVWVNGQWALAEAYSQSRSQYEPSDTLDADLFFSMSCEDLGFVQDGVDPNNNPSYRWTENVPYDFYLLNSNFEHEMFKADSSLPGMAFTNSAGTECSIDFDYTSQTNIAAGDSVVVFADPRQGVDAEEFIINTIVDRNDTIEPQASLDIDELGIFYNSIGGIAGHGSLVHTYKDGDKIVTQERYYNTSEGWSDSWNANDAYSFTPYQINGNTLYQVSVQMTEDSVASYTYWTNDTQTMLSLFAGQELCMDGETSDSCAEPEATRYYTDEADAQQALEAALNQPITFNGKSWYVKDSKDDKENYTITFGDKVTAIFDYSEPGEKSEYVMNWDQLASEIAVPACVADDSCTLQTFTTTVEQCDSDDGSTFEECAIGDKYLRIWSYNTEDDSITEQKYSLEYNKVTNTAIWTKQ